MESATTVNRDPAFINLTLKHHREMLDYHTGLIRTQQYKVSNVSAKGDKEMTKEALNALLINSQNAIADLNAITAAAQTWLDQGV